MAYQQPKTTATDQKIIKNINDKAKNLQSLSLDERAALWKSAADILIDPDKQKYIDKDTLIAFATSGSKREQVERRSALAAAATEAGRQQYKYNINQSGANELLFDIRNFHNFRGTREEFIADPKYNSPIRPGTSPSKSYYMTQRDFLFANEFDLNVSEDFASRPEVQPIILNEFQPKNIAYMTKYLDKLVAFFDGRDSTIGKLVNGLVGTANTIAEPLKTVTANVLMERYSANPILLYGDNSPASDTLGNPVEMIRTMFNGGKWLNTYELPFFKNTYLLANQHNSWKSGGISEALGKTVGQIAKDGLSIDFPTTPTFKIENMGDAGYPEGDLSFSFYLINKSTEWLERNFRFLHAFYAGNQWLTMTGGFTKSPNIYHVLCPGRFQIFWASIGSTITFEGKLRKNNYMSNTYSSVLRSINKETLWPDAWKIEIKIKDLTPNNFNTYAEYFVHGFGETQLNILNKLAVTSNNYITGVYSDDPIVNAANKALREEAQKLRDQQDAKYVGLTSINREVLTTVNGSNAGNTAKLFFGKSETDILKENAMAEGAQGQAVRESINAEIRRLNTLYQEAGSAETRQQIESRLTELREKQNQTRVRDEQNKVLINNASTR